MAHQGSEAHDLAAGVTLQQKGVGGSYVYIAAATYPVTITLYFENGEPQTYTHKKAGWRWRPGQHAPLDRRRFIGYALQSDETQSVRVDVAEDADADQIPQDELTVKDTTTGRAVALRAEAFGGYVESVANAAPGFSRCQLWNPAGSGVNVVLKNLAAYNSGAGGSINVGIMQARISAAVTAGVNKLGGGAASVAEMVVDNTLNVRTHGERIFNIRPEWFPWDCRDKEIVIPPGYGLTLENNTGNDYLRSVFEWEEEEA